MLELIFGLVVAISSGISQPDAITEERLVRVGGVVCDDAVGVRNYLRWASEFKLTPDQASFKRWLPQCDYYGASRIWVRGHDLSFHSEGESLFVIQSIRLPHSKRMRYGVVTAVPMKLGEVARLWPRPFCLLKCLHETPRKLSLPGGDVGGGG